MGTGAGRWSNLAERSIKWLIGLIGWGAILVIALIAVIPVSPITFVATVAAVVVLASRFVLPRLPRLPPRVVARARPLGRLRVVLPVCALGILAVNGPILFPGKAAVYVFQCASFEWACLFRRTDRLAGREVVLFPAFDFVRPQLAQWNSSGTVYRLNASSRSEIWTIAAPTEQILVRELDSGERPMVALPLLMHRRATFSLSVAKVRDRIELHPAIGVGAMSVFVPSAVDDPASGFFTVTSTARPTFEDFRMASATDQMLVRTIENGVEPHQEFGDPVVKSLLGLLMASHAARGNIGALGTLDQLAHSCGLIARRSARHPLTRSQQLALAQAWFISSDSSDDDGRHPVDHSDQFSLFEESLRRHCTSIGEVAGRLNRDPSASDVAAAFRRAVGAEGTPESARAFGDAWMRLSRPRSPSPIADVVSRSPFDRSRIAQVLNADGLVTSAEIYQVWRSLKRLDSGSFGDHLARMQELRRLPPDEAAERIRVFDMQSVTRLHAERTYWLSRITPKSAAARSLLRSMARFDDAQIETAREEGRLLSSATSREAFHAYYARLVAMAGVSPDSDPILILLRSNGEVPDNYCEPNAVLEGLVDARVAAPRGLYLSTARLSVCLPPGEEGAGLRSALVDHERVSYWPSPVIALLWISEARHGQQQERLANELQSRFGAFPPALCRLGIPEGRRVCANPSSALATVVDALE